MLNEIKAIKDMIRYLEACEDGLVENEDVREGYHQAIDFLKDYLNDTQEELEFEYGDSKYTPAESYYGF